MKLVFYSVFSNNEKHPRLRNVIQRLFTFSLPIYLAITNGILYHVFSLWCEYQEDNSVYTIEYKNGQFNQCVKTSREKVTNLRNDFSRIESHHKSLFLMLSSLIFLLFHIIETLTNCHNGVANLSRFVYGPNDQECLDQSKPEEEGIELSEVSNMLPQDIVVPKQKSKSKPSCMLTAFRGLMSVLGFAFLVLLCLAPMMFHLLNKDDNERGIVKLTDQGCIRLLNTPKYCGNTHEY